MVWHGKKVPKPAVSRCSIALHRGPLLFDHLVGGGEQRWRHFEPKCFCSLEIDHQLEFGWLLHRQIGRALTPENPSGIDADLIICLSKADAVAHQTASSRIVSKFIDGRNGVAGSQFDEFFAAGVLEKGWRPPGGLWGERGPPS